MGSDTPLTPDLRDSPSPKDSKCYSAYYVPRLSTSTAFGLMIEWVDMWIDSMSLLNPQKLINFPPRWENHSHTFDDFKLKFESF